jgi:adenosine deaminase
MFGCTLIGEYRLAADAFGFSEEELRGIAENGFRYAFRSRNADAVEYP